MAFTHFKSLGDVLQKYDITLQEDNFLPEKFDKKIDLAILESEIKLSLNELAYDISEAAICETLIFPILRENWKAVKDDFLLWSHTTITADEELTGIPDYLFAKKTKFGRAVVGTPICITVEAKKDNFDEGWGQCAAEMVASQKLNLQANKEQENIEVYGLVTNGEFWEFSKLDRQIFTKNKTIYSIFELRNLYLSIETVLNNCKNQLSTPFKKEL
jgi:hypothetical protein